MITDYNTSTDDNNDDNGTLDKCNNIIACVFSFITVITNGTGGVSEET